MGQQNPSLKIGRRDFLKGALGVSAAGVLVLPALAKPSKPVGSSRVALISDTHICEDPDRLYRGVKPVENLLTVTRQILDQPELPAAATISGDCVILEGKPGDYAQLRKTLKPLREGGVPIYLLLGNHDNRDAFWNEFPERKKGLEVIPDDERHVRTLSLPNVDMLLLDSFISSNHTPGKLGEKQLKWIDQKLGNMKEKPIILMAHHDTREAKYHALLDYPELLKIMRRHPQVKAYFCGHWHRWIHNKNEKLWEVCIPTTAHVMRKEEPQGWVDGQFRPDGVTLTLHTIDPKHPKRGEVLKLDWAS